MRTVRLLTVVGGGGESPGVSGGCVCNSSSFHYLLKVSKFLEFDLIEYLLWC